MSFESPDMAKDFPGLYMGPDNDEDAQFDDEDKPARKKEALVRRRESRPERRGKGYRMFEEEDSEEELVAEDMSKSPVKMKKHSKPSFKFAKREKFYKPKEKDRDREREPPHFLHGAQRERDKSADKNEKGDGHKEKKKEEKLRWRKKKLLGPGFANPAAQSFKSEQPQDVVANTKAIFGVPLAVGVERSIGHDGIQLPIIVRECIDYIEEIGLSCEGIYRISGVKSKVTSLKDQYNKHMTVYLHEHEPNIIASLLKLYLRELPEPVLTKELMPKFEEASTQKNVKQKVEMFQQLIEQLPVPNKLLLSWMIVHMTHVIAKEKQNKMTLQNVSIVLSPTMQISHRVLNVLFTYARILFKDTILKRYVPPLKPVTSKWSLDLPESPSALEEELRKQESLLSQLHEDVMNRNDTDKEEQLWEVQRVVTQLKRKIKMMKKTLEKDVTRQEPTSQKPEHVAKQLKFSPKHPQKTQLRLVVKEETEKEQPKEVKQKTDETGNKINDDVQKEKEPSVERTEESAVTDMDIDSVDSNKEMKESDEKTESSVKDSGDKDVEVEIVDTVKEGESKAPEESIKDSGEESVKETVEAVVEGDDKPAEETVETGDKSDIVKETSDDDLTPTEASEGFSQSEVKNDSSRSSIHDESARSSVHEDSTKSSVHDGSARSSVHEEEPLAETPDTPQAEPPEMVPEVGESTDETRRSSSNVVVDPVLAEPPVSRKVSTSSDEVEQTKEEIQVEVHAESGTKPLDTSEEFILPPPMDSDSDSTDDEVVQQQYNELLLEEEELLAMGDELRVKIVTEQSEIERLHQEIVELKSIREDLYDSEEASSDSSDEYEDDDELRELLEELKIKNEKLESENHDLSENVHQEREACLNVKVQIRMIQQRQLESSGGMLLMDGISERDALIDSLL